MDRSFLKDLRCPQYVDFLDGIDSNSESPFFDCNEYQTPQNRNPEKRSPVPEAGLTEDDENKLMDKMTAALSFIESTPKVKKTVLREKLFTAKAPVNPIKMPELRPLTKVGNVQMLPTRIRSKTVARLDKIFSSKDHKAKDFKSKKRSSSLNDLRTVYKKHTLPKTPLCLKRTIDAKARAKALKTTEEMELEQITELQKQLSKMLRQNEIAYRKLNSKQKPAPPKNAETKPGTSKGNTDMNADKNSRPGFKSMSNTAIKKVLKLDSIINGNASGQALSKALTASVSSTKDLERSKLPSVSSSIMSEDGEKSLSLVSKKPANIGFHSGVFFCDSSKKNTVPKPFTFEARMKQKILSSGNRENSKVVSTNSEVNHNRSSCKENIPVMNAKSEVKIQNMKNMKPLTSKKPIGGSNRNTGRGSFFPLAETTNRN